MTKGGHSRSGPAPDPNALRRSRPSDAAGWRHLPAVGRLEPAPGWPLEGQSEREAHLWESFWRKPQAIIWEEAQLFEQVALFVRQFIEAEKPSSSAENRKTVRMMFADLWLTPDSMLRARIKIVDEAGEEASVPAEGASVTDIRKRFSRGAG